MKVMIRFYNLFDARKFHPSIPHQQLRTTALKPNITHDIYQRELKIRNEFINAISMIVMLHLFMIKQTFSICV